MSIFQLYMNEFHIARIARELRLNDFQVLAASLLLDQGATVPFIARYRKEATNSLDEMAIASIRDRMIQLRDLELRRESILKSLEERGQSTDDLKTLILDAGTMATLEDIYLPHRPKRRTRATVARERGLEPLAKMIFSHGDLDPTRFINQDKGVCSIDEALAGARDIIAEWINEDATSRAKLRNLNESQGVIRSKASRGKNIEGAKYKDYFDRSEPLAGVPSHRLMAMMRGQKEGFLTIHEAPEEEEALIVLETIFIRGTGAASKQVSLAICEGYKRLLAPSMETEVLSNAWARAEDEAVKVFAENLRQLLLESPLGQDLKPGMRLPGIVTNITAFGAFVNIGVHQDGLVHLSQLSDRFVRNPADVVKVRQKVVVRVMDVDLERKRISLSLRDNLF